MKTTTRYSAYALIGNSFKSSIESDSYCPLIESFITKQESLGLKVVVDLKEKSGRIIQQVYKSKAL